METLVRPTTVLQNLAFWVFQTQLQLKAGSTTSTATPLLLLLDPDWPRLSCHKVNYLRCMCADVFSVDWRTAMFLIIKCKSFALEKLPIHYSSVFWSLDCQLTGCWIRIFCYKIWSNFCNLQMQFHVARLFNYSLFQDPPWCSEKACLFC